MSGSTRQTRAWGETISLRASRRRHYGYIDMCNDETEAENEIFLAQRRLRRRDVTKGAAAVAMLAGCNPPPPRVEAPAPAPTDPSPAPSAGPAPPASEPQGLPTRSRRVTVKTPDGEADAFFVFPTDGQHPGVLLWPDVAGLRGAYETMATRLAGEGYAVLAVNCYYRSAKAPILNSIAEWRAPEGRAKIKPMREALTAEAITKDAGAFVAWLDEQPEVDPGKKLGTQGYCMGGPFTFRTAAASERVGAIASFHGGGLVTEADHSPHRLFSKMKAAALICIAQNDDARQPEAKGVLAKSAEDAGIEAEIEVYPAQHGWCTIDAPIYDKAQAERAYARLLATYRAHL